MLLDNGLNQEGQAPGNAGVVSVPPTPTGQPVAPHAPADPAARFAGKGELLEADDQTVFRTLDDMVRRQERLARNRLAIDAHYTATKLGYWGSTLTKVENHDQYVQSYLPGTRNRLQTGAVPNKQAELCQKLTETLLVDPPRLEPEAEDDSEEAQRGAELAREYLQQDATEAGTDDLTLFAAQIEGATTRASTFNHYWIDPTGGGSIPKQIKAHPLAVDPAHPLVAPDGQPTTDYVLRYVTAGDETGQGAQFTIHPSEAERVWVPRVRIDQLGREHVRLFPETADLHHAQQAIVLYFCTVAEAKRRWPETVGTLDDRALTSLIGWIPLRPTVLLPVALRGKWREGFNEGLRDGDAAKGIDQRLLFFYAYYGLSDPDYPEGAAIACNGMNGGYVFGRDTLTATVEVPSTTRQDETVTDRKDLDLPLVQVRLLPDVDDRDPMGRCFMERIAGAGESGSIMATAMAEAIDQVLHPVRYSIGTSSPNADDVENARATGSFVPVMTKDETPYIEEVRTLPPAFFPYIGWLHDQMDASAGLRPPDTAGEAKVKSGVALRIEVDEATKALTRMNYAVHAAWSRHGRVKLQFVMKYFSVPQMLRYVGVDGAAKQEWFTGNDFARVGQITIASGSGTMLPATEKVNLAVQLQGAMLVDGDEAADIARPAFAKTLGLPDNPHVQRIERQVSAWLEGPPEGWEEAQAAFQQAAVAHAAMAQQEFAAGAMAPSVPPPVAPWTPFAPLPVDGEPPIAAIRKRRLGREMAHVAFSAQPPAWQAVLLQAYNEAVESLRASQMAAQAAAAPQPQAPAGDPAGGQSDARGAA